jgi:hypothetical protein
MKPKHIAIALLALPLSPAFADEVPPILKIINKKIDALKALQVGDYRLAWGNEDATINSIIAAAAAGTATNDLPTAIKSAVASAKQTRSHGQSCVISLAITNNGAYTSSRECTTEYATRSHMDTSIYPAMQAYLVGRLPHIDFAQNNGGYGFAAFYTPAGHMSEFIVFTNSTQ